MIYCSLRCILLWICLLISFDCTKRYPSVAAMTEGGSAYENMIETQIDPRPPSTFRNWDNPENSKPHMEFLSVRSEGFKFFEFGSANNRQNYYAGNWEIFAMQYWYETRPYNMSCPQTPRGIGTHCDWALMVPCLFADLSRPPKLVFVHTMMLPHFVESTLGLLPNKTWKFIVISGGMDRSVPYNALDSRYRAGLRGFTGGNYFERLVTHPQVAHWYAENRDTLHPKFSSLPTGMLQYSEDFDNITTPDHPLLPLSQRPLKFMSADRVRAGSQWQERADVLANCRNSPLCVQPYGQIESELDHQEVSHLDYLRFMASVPFILCPHGGGIDPSPKAFEAVYVGTVPIIRRTPYIYDSYAHLPVAFVDDWSEIFSSNQSEVESMLKRWVAELGPYYEPGSELRRKVIHRLSMDYWVEKMLEKLEAYERNSTVAEFSISKQDHFATLGKSHHHEGLAVTENSRRRLRH